ncbi:hypothetical protein [Noviherbaspirillum sp.]|uniref:hypothetical protein n=1 Tax=Noviherbaspirillum sp. TaxID=1926288 RepID=UPI002B459A18|nr:hypothetical protein [Noviherbaspirillum sp.]HJV80326.1 hypothetical protein [Noviherbaspirillum sp.]
MFMDASWDVVKNDVSRTRGQGKSFWRGHFSQIKKFPSGSADKPSEPADPAQVEQGYSQDVCMWACVEQTKQSIN